MSLNYFFLGRMLDVIYLFFFCCTANAAVTSAGASDGGNLFLKLPDDVRSEIFGYLSSLDLEQLSMTSSSLNKITEKDLSARALDLAAFIKAHLSHLPPFLAQSSEESAFYRPERKRQKIHKAEMEKNIYQRAKELCRSFGFNHVRLVELAAYDSQAEAEVKLLTQQSGEITAGSYPLAKPHYYAHKLLQPKFMGTTRELCKQACGNVQRGEDLLALALPFATFLALSLPIDVTIILFGQATSLMEMSKGSVAYSRRFLRPKMGDKEDFEPIYERREDDSKPWVPNLAFTKLICQGTRVIDRAIKKKIISKIKKDLKGRRGFCFPSMGRPTL